jgi:hypothetical protein
MKYPKFNSTHRVGDIVDVWYWGFDNYIPKLGDAYLKPREMQLLERVRTGTSTQTWLAIDCETGQIVGARENRDYTGKVSFHSMPQQNIFIS